MKKELNNLGTLYLQGSVEKLLVKLTSGCFKGIVSRDWGELQMISVDSLEVLSITGSYFYFLKQCFHA